jgi:hypothetical protein
VGNGTTGTRSGKPGVFCDVGADDEAVGSNSKVAAAAAGWLTDGAARSSRASTSMTRWATGGIDAGTDGTPKKDSSRPCFSGALRRLLDVDGSAPVFVDGTRFPMLGAECPRAVEVWGEQSNRRHDVTLECTSASNSVIVDTPSGPAAGCSRSAVHVLRHR